LVIRVYPPGLLEYRVERVWKSLGRRVVGGSNVSGSDSGVEDEEEEAVGYSSGFRGGVFVSNDSGE
jgi:hypothetical protein